MARSRDGGHRGEDELLVSCYARSLESAGGAGLSSIAFPCISTGAYGFPRDRAARIAIETGAYGFPRDRAARIAIETVAREAPRYATLDRVMFCCYSESDATMYRRLLQTFEDGTICFTDGPLMK